LVEIYFDFNSLIQTTEILCSFRIVATQGINEECLNVYQFPSHFIFSLETTETPEQPDPIDLIKPSSNDDYINMIRKRLNEDASARAEREKRRRKVLVDQIKAHEAQEVLGFMQTLLLDGLSNYETFFCNLDNNKG